ncbi:unnamed protein product [Paramecium octaurelia]|uniref:PiggyBac transposable element-derived protein domain-containing protein n=1 Tax=Paramecium octaurelia TaxID=43137 RepID=A0A8S1UL33_PAROT|nr:unnamed protein product [Paramecium octaurelia]
MSEITSNQPQLESQFLYELVNQIPQPIIQNQSSQHVSIDPPPIQTHDQLPQTNNTTEPLVPQPIQEDNTDPQDQNQAQLQHPQPIPNQEPQQQEEQLIPPRQEVNSLVILAALESNDEDKKSQEEADCKLLYKKQRQTSIIIDDDIQDDKTTPKKTAKNEKNNVLSPQQEDPLANSQNESEKQEVVLPPPSQRSSEELQPEIQKPFENKTSEDKSSLLDQMLKPEPALKKLQKEFFSFTQPVHPTTVPSTSQKKTKNPIVIDSDDELPPPSNISILKQKIEDTTPSSFFRKKPVENQTPIEVGDNDNFQSQQVDKQQKIAQLLQQPTIPTPVSNKPLNQQQRKHQALLEEIVQEDDGIVQDIENQDWTLFSQLNNMVPPKFSGQFRMLEYKDNPQEMIRLLFGETRFKDLMKTCQTSEPEFWLYLGTKLIMGYMRLPDINEYFYGEDWIAGGGIKSIITQQQFDDIDQKVEIIQPKLQTESQLAVKLEFNAQSFFRQEFLPQFTQELNDRFKKLILPGQELFLISNFYTIIYSTKIQWYQLIDKESGIILQQFFWATPINKALDLNSHRDLQKRLRMMFEPYHLGRHIVYSQGLLNAESVLQLYQQKIFVCTDLVQHSLLPHPPTGDQQVFYSSKNKEPIYLCYKNQQWITCVSLQSLQLRSQYLQELSQLQFTEEKIAIQPSEPENTSINSNSKIIFIFVIESILHNIRILKKQEIKTFRTELALQLINKVIDYKNPKPLLRKDGSLQVDRSCQTDQTVGIVNDQLYHCPIHNGNARCQVCLSKSILSKTTASCLGCNKVLGTNIFLCIYPCFRLFHLNPKLYLKEGMYYQIVCGYDQYDQDQEDEEVDQQFLDANLRFKPDTSELDSIYAKSYQDFKNMIPINYEDNYHKKTTIVVIQREKGGNRRGGGRPKASRQQQQSAQNQAAQAEQGNQGDTQDAPKKVRKQNKKAFNAPQQQGQPEKETEQASSAMFDFFSQVRKQAYKKQTLP